MRSKICSRLLLLVVSGLLCSNLLLADLITGFTTGSFDEDLPHLSFTGTSFSGSVNDTIVFGTFNFERPGTNQPDVYNNATFVLNLLFTSPDDFTFTHSGILSGTVTKNGNGNKISIDFPDAPTQLGLCVSNQNCDSFYLTVNDLNDLEPGAFGNPDAYDLTGTISRTSVDPAFTPTPEPGSLILLATAGAVCFTLRKKLRA